METDFELLDAWQKGDAAAGSSLFARHFDSVFRFFDRKVQGDASDLVQLTFLACVEAGPSFRRHASFRTFLFAIARNQLYRHWRDRRGGKEVDFGATSLADLGPTPSRLALDKQQHRLLLEALRAVPLEQQILVELHYWEGMSGPDLAEVLEIPEGTVRSRLRLAREALEQQVARLADSPALLQSTVSDLDGWAASLRLELGKR
jgi:RNA polymerase sigma-70 factor (ECF subfamily)